MLKYALIAVIFSSSSFANYYDFDSEGYLLRPENYREWIFAGTATTPKSVYKEVLFPDFQNVYIDPKSYQYWKTEGEFPDGTILVKELLTKGPTQSAVGNGFYQGDYYSLSVALKSKEMFPNTDGNWNYFSFVDKKAKRLKSKSKALGERCSSCHQNNAPDGAVFYNYFSVLRDAKGFGEGAPENLDTRIGLK
ncbi:cytochrome P460 family protein [Vibrio sp. Sgm 5]|uniref:cytochrome P460 family protein n=1 Tax=Vibrio sp. Sgm 5 TaxID=2994387 RepID=UPI002248AFF8|nr:cytochrome P460 family protein [Vibrio sp. Sgm 5]MCX2789532.1 cytochrome P460 family protein [Vibrio sp. Sgm 5]